VGDTPRYRLDDLRRFGAALAAGLGVAPARAAALATHLLWFDAAGASAFGIAGLPDWLGRIERREVDPQAEGRVRCEHAATVVFEGQHGLPPLVLGRAGALAGEKARDVGVGVVRVTQVGPSGPAAAWVAERALGPEVALALGPGPNWALALPTADGLPLVLDAALGPASPAVWEELAAPWAVLVPEGGWLIVALAVTALEPLATFHERVQAALARLNPAPGRLLPGPWHAARSAARAQGIAIDSAAWAELVRWANRLGVTPPEQLRAEGRVPSKESPRTPARDEPRAN
jgi:LDH2 family malate/lactate/ureidoglycolate dehydrogenase